MTAHSEDDPLVSLCAIARAIHSSPLCGATEPDGELWQALLTCSTTSATYIVLVESFIYNLTPRAILERHPQLFSDIRAIYQIKLSLFEYLRANQEFLKQKSLGDT